MSRSPSGGWERRLRRGRLPGSRYVRVLRPFAGKFQRRGGRLVATEEVFERRSAFTRALEASWRGLVGARLASEMEAQERLGTTRGLAIFASDNISSSAYATEEIMRVLVLAGAGALTLTIPTTVAVVAVLIVVVTSYYQTISAYPTGGGSYIVAKDNLTALPGLTAGASLLTDYVLTVAVSVSAGVAALISIFPTLFEERVLLALGFVAIICVGNLRGIRESGTLFAAPVYVYLLAIFGLIGYGLFRYLSGSLPAYVPPLGPAESESHQALGLLLIMRAFSSGCVALTGVEAVSNGVPAFAPPETKRAQRVLLIMATLFVSIFLGISLLSSQIGILPDPSERTTIVSQLASALVGTNTPYHYLVQLSTALLLVLAANTAFAGFPRLASILARDAYWPRQFQYRGDRLAFSTGILVLTVLAGALLVMFRASVTNLIPLYTVGVFIAFTLSQTGMVRHWWRLRAEVPGWRRRALVNGVGATATAIVALVVGIAKFQLGAWVVLVLIPVLMAAMLAIHRHYRSVEAELSLELLTQVAVEGPPRVIVPISRLDRAALRALAFARSISSEVLAVHVSDEPQEAEALRLRWEQAGLEPELVIVDSPYRALLPPLLAYIEAIRTTTTRPVVVVLAEFVPRRFWQYFLHNQTALRLKFHLYFQPGVIVVDVPTHSASRART